MTAINRAIESCKTTGSDPNNHFRGVTKMVKLGSGAERAIEDYMLTRYASYLIAQNGDPRKEAIAFAQSYFAIQTRKQELIEDRMRLQARLEARERLWESEKTLSQNIYERGVDDAGFGRIRSKGDAALFGGNTTQAMKSKFGITQTRPLADFLPTLTIAAKNLATEMTSHNVQQDDNLHGESIITREHARAKMRGDAILTALTRYEPELSSIKGIGFCVTIRHAVFMAEQFTQRGIPSGAFVSGIEDGRF
jgi:DNA-damage-inducible protein D